jgi:hypothetical protein
LADAEAGAAKDGAKPDAVERLHQRLHHVAALDGRPVASILVDAMTDTLGADAVELVIESLARRLPNAGGE